MPGPAQPPVPADGRVELVGAVADGLAVLSIIATETTAPGYVQALGCAESAGAYSNLNSDRAGQTIANLAVAHFNGAGSLCLYTQGGGHLIADLQGYFDSSIYAASNKRLLDSRSS